jgi:hypothetical protein
VPASSSKQAKPVAVTVKPRVLDADITHMLRNYVG